MPLENRIKLIRQVETLRGSKVICYLTSLRQNVAGVMSDDTVRVFFDHLLLLPTRPIPKLDIFLCSNGGSGTIHWRLVSLFREFAGKFNVLVPYRAYSAASLLALGADEIVMHPFAELGPIDPSVQNEFNPVEQGTLRRLGISVEDVRAYVNFIKNTVGISHDDELIKAIEILAQKVHPLALGNVERFISQTRMIARKILKTHMEADADEHRIDEIVENMASKLYFHGHPINRLEAKDELKLSVNVELQPELEIAMWDLYKDYEEEFQNRVEFNPLSLLIANAGNVAPNTPNQVETDFLHVYVDSLRLSSKYTTRRRYTQTMQQTPMGIQPNLVEEILSQGWSNSPVQQPDNQNPPRTSSSADAPSA